MFEIDSTLTYELTGPAEFLFQIHALDGDDQQVLSETLTITPDMPFRVGEDPLGGGTLLRLQAQAGDLNVHYQARVARTVEPLHPQSAIEVPIARLPDAVMPYLLPSRYCESDLLSRAAQKLFGDLAPGHSRVAAICDWIHNRVDYEVGTSDPTTTACDVFTRRAGVCRDFAHLGITFCRSLNIPARLVAGYARFEDPPPDFHAVFEAFLGDRWILFDATRMSPVDEMIRIVSGRDAKDVAFATIYGPAVMTGMSPLLSESCVVPADKLTNLSLSPN